MLESATVVFFSPSYCYELLKIFQLLFSLNFNLENQSERDSLSSKDKDDIGRKNRSKSRSGRPSSKNWRNLDTVKILAGKLGHSTSSLSSAVSVSTSVSASSSHERLPLVQTSNRSESLVVVHKNVKKAQTVGAQFQHSLQSLMVALNMANPFFIRCIKSNRLKVDRKY